VLWGIVIKIAVDASGEAEARSIVDMLLDKMQVTPPGRQYAFNSTTERGRQRHILTLLDSGMSSPTVRRQSCRA